MNRRSFLLCAPALPMLAQSRGSVRKRPNIVVVMMDDFGVGQFAPHAEEIDSGDLDPVFLDFLERRKVKYTSEEAIRFARTAMPTICELARGGVVFTNAFAPSNLCAPSRTGVLTGRLQNRFGHYQNIDVEASGIQKGAVLAERLHDAGYATGFIGKWHAGTRDESLRQGVLRKHNLSQREFAQLSGPAKAQIEAEIRQTGYLGAVTRDHHPLNHGFDYYFGYNRWECPFYDSEHIWENWSYSGLQKRYNTELFTEKAVDFISRARKNGKSFFVELCYHAVHGPLKPKAPDKYFDRFPSSSYQLSNFYAHVNAVDAGIASIREALGADWKNTLFIFCADNGAPLGLDTPLPGNAPHSGHKGTFLEGGIRVPMLAHWPEGFKGGQKTSALVSMLDIMPTALDAAAAPHPDGLDGRSLLPLLSGRATKVHDYLFWAGIHSRAWGFLGETVIGDAQQRREESPGAWVVTDGRYVLRYVTTTPPGLYKEVPDGAPPIYELFDLQTDPGERTNLYERIPEVAKRLEAIYKKEARDLPPPSKWRRDRWRALMPADKSVASKKLSDR